MNNTYQCIITDHIKDGTFLSRNQLVYVNENEKTYLIQAKDITTSHYVGFPINYNKCDNLTNDKKISEQSLELLCGNDVWYLLGICLNATELFNHDHIVFHFDHDNDKNEVMFSTIKKYVKLIKKSEFIDDDDEEYYTDNKLLYDLLVPFNRSHIQFNKLHNIKIIPDHIENGTDEQIKNFIDGYLLYNQFLKSDKHVRMVSKNLNVALALQRMYIKIGIFTEIYKPNNLEYALLASFDDNKDKYFIKDDFVWYKVKDNNINFVSKNVNNDETCTTKIMFDVHDCYLCNNIVIF